MTKILIGRGDTDLDYPICRPSLDLDFTQEVLDSRITFTRGSIGTRVNRNRVIETVDANQPRFDYDPITGECKGLLIEESRQNLFLYSQNHNIVGTWINQASISNNNTSETLAPDGTNTATKLIGNSGARTRQSVYQTISVTSGVTYTFSVFLKAAERRYVCIWFDNFNVSQGPFYGASNYIDLQTGTIPYEGTSGAIKIVPYPNGWYRLYVTATPTITGSFNFNTAIGTPNNYADTSIPNTFKYTGDAKSGVYIWGSQVEAGAFPTSYIPTSASTVTRSADLASMTGTNFSSWYNSSEGTLYADLNNITTRSSLTYDAFVSLTGTDVNRNVMRIYTQTASGGAAQNQFFGAVSYSPDGSYTFNSFDTTVSGSPQRIGKAILAYKKDDFAFTVNGLKPATDRSGDIPTCNQLLIYGASRFQSAPSGYIKRLTYYPRRLKDNQLQYLTQ